MGRKKIVLKKIECVKERSSKYSKRKKGILKKAGEMAVLCDVDIVLLMFSPTFKPSLFTPHSKSLGIILEKLSKMSEQDREERRAYTMQTLQKLLNKDNTEEIPSESHSHYLSSESDEVLQEDDKVIELRESCKLLDESLSILRDWENPYRVHDLARLSIMEDHLVSTLNQISKIKIQED